MIFYLFCAIFALTAASFMVGRKRAMDVSGFTSLSLHSRPSYHGTYVAMWAGLPSLVLVILWLLFQGTIVDNLLLSSIPEARKAGLDPSQIDLLLSEVKAVSAGRIFGAPDAEVLAAAERYQSWAGIARWSMVACALALLLLGMVAARSRIAPHFRARQGVERIMDGLMIFCSLIAIFTTLGIVASLLFESFRFFERVPVAEFLFGLRWEPQIAIREDQVVGAGSFGAIPVFAGTLLIAFIAMIVAVPVGLLSAIYLAEYATSRFRAIVKWYRCTQS